MPRMTAASASGSLVAISIWLTILICSGDGGGWPAGVSATINGPMPLPLSSDSARPEMPPSSPGGRQPAPPRVAERKRSGCIVTSLSVVKPPSE